MEVGDTFSNTLFALVTTMNGMTDVIFEKGDFMKKQLTVALGLAVLATPAFASKARLEALGEDNFGSYYIHDNRNIFLNVAKINDNKDLVTYEFGAATSNSSAAADSVAAPRAEGGFTKASGNLVWGAHFGNSTATAATARSLVTDGQERNPIDLFVGGDAGVKWGANVTYEGFDGSSSAGSANRVSSNSLRTRLGVVSGDLEALAQVSIKGDVKDRSSNQGMEGKAGYLLGVGYMMNSYKFFADYTKAGAEYGTVADTDSDWDYSRIRVGVARQEKLNDKATLFTKLQLSQSTSEADSGVAGLSAAGEDVTRALPLTVGMEYDAASWLQLRASVIQNIWASNEFDPEAGTTVKSSVASTAVRAGASLKFGEFSVDGLVSTDSNSDSAGTVDTTGGNGGLRTDSLMTRVSTTYRF